MSATQTTLAQTFSVLHSFSNGADGAQPWAGVTLDVAGNLYGTASAGGYFTGNCATYNGCGTVFKLKAGGSEWVFSTLYTFRGPDGATPYGEVIFGAGGALYGTAFEGGSHCCGVAFNLRPPQTFCRSVSCSWMETLLWSFGPAPDGNNPLFGSLLFDNAGHAFGTTPYGGEFLSGSLFELTKLPSGAWSENVNYSFGHLSGGGQQPYNNVVSDNNGNLYTTTSIGGASGLGAVVELVNSPSGWTEHVLYSFAGRSDGGIPYGGVIFDQAGNLYGTTTTGSNQQGTVFELTPSNGGWIFNVIYTFNHDGSWSSLSLDAGGNLYGTAADGAFGNGAIFKLTRSNGGWTYSSLHDFSGGDDGGGPAGRVILDSHGNLYGTTVGGGLNQCSGVNGCGVVWEITP